MAILQLVVEYLEVAKKHNLDVCQIAIAFTIKKAYMSSSIIGATTMEQLKTNIDAINLNLSDEVLADIEKSEENIQSILEIGLSHCQKIFLILICG